MPALAWHDPQAVSLLVLAAVLAGFVRGVSGFGGPAVMMLSLTPFYVPATVLIKVLLVDYLANIRMVPSTVKHVDKRLCALMIGSSLAGMPLGLLALDVIAPDIMKRVVAAVAGSFTVIMLVGVRFKTTPRWWLTAALGLFAGVVLGATLIAFPAMVFLLALPMAAASSRANGVLWGFMTSTALIAAHVLSGAIGWGDIWRCALIGLAYLLTTYLGDLTFLRMTERNFRRYVLWFLLALSLIGLLA